MSSVADAQLEIGLGDELVKGGIMGWSTLQLLRGEGPDHLQAIARAVYNVEQRMARCWGATGHKQFSDALTLELRSSKQQTAPALHSSTRRRAERESLNVDRLRLRLALLQRIQ